MGTQKYMIGSAVYFILLFVVVTLFSISGVFSNGEVVTNTGFSSSLQSGGANITQDADDLGFKKSDYMKDIFSFFVWNISIYSGETLMSYFWVFRTFFVYLPLLILLLNIWYSLPTISG